MGKKGSSPSGIPAAKMHHQPENVLTTPLLTAGGRGDESFRRQSPETTKEEVFEDFFPAVHEMDPVADIPPPPPLPASAAAMLGGGGPPQTASGKDGKRRPTNRNRSRSRSRSSSRPRHPAPTNERGRPRSAPRGDMDPSPQRPRHRYPRRRSSSHGPIQRKRGEGARPNLGVKSRSSREVVSDQGRNGGEGERSLSRSRRNAPQQVSRGNNGDDSRDGDLPRRSASLDRGTDYSGSRLKFAPRGTLRLGPSKRNLIESDHSQRPQEGDFPLLSAGHRPSANGNHGRHASASATGGRRRPQHRASDSAALPEPRSRTRPPGGRHRSSDGGIGVAALQGLEGGLGSEWQLKRSATEGGAEKCHRRNRSKDMVAMEGGDGEWQLKRSVTEGGENARHRRQGRVRQSAGLKAPAASSSSPYLGVTEEEEHENRERRLQRSVTQGEVRKQQEHIRQSGPMVVSAVVTDGELRQRRREAIRSAYAAVATESQADLIRRSATGQRPPNAASATSRPRPRGGPPLNLTASAPPQHGRVRHDFPSAQRAGGAASPHHEQASHEHEKRLGDGPLRFAPKGERPLSVQIAWLSMEEKSCFEALKTKWEKRYRQYRRFFVFSDDYYLRFARYHKFHEENAWAAMEGFDPRYMALSSFKLEKQLRTKTLFVPPGLKSKDGHDMFYMKPARYFPKETSTRTIIDNLAYVMSTMAEREHACTDGIGFLANMDEWTFTNFSMGYCFEFMQMLQGRVPVHVRLFLIVNPPSWFGKIWAKMKPMLTEDFRKCVHMIKEEELPKYMGEGYRNYMPDEMKTGRADTDKIVDDFIAFRKHIERVLRESQDEEGNLVTVKKAKAGRAKLLTAQEDLLRGMARLKWQGKQKQQTASQ